MRAPLAYGIETLRRLDCLTAYRVPALGIVLLLVLAACTGPGRAVSIASPPPTRIALLGDIHVDHGTNQALHARRFALAIAAVNAAKVDLVLLAGDLMEHGSAAEISAFQAQVKGFQAPVWQVPGNHDVGDKPGKNVKRPVTAEGVAAYELAFGKSYFAREHAGVRVVGLNSLLLGSGLPPEAEQWQFLEQALARPAVRPTLLLLHQLLYEKTPEDRSGIYWNVEPVPRQRLLPLLKQGGVQAVLSGHLHRPLTNHYEGILLLTAPPVSYGLPKGKQPEGWVLLTVAGGEVRHEIQILQDPGP